MFSTLRSFVQRGGLAATAFALSVPVSAVAAADEFVPYVTLRAEEDAAALRTFPLEGGRVTVAALPVGRYRVAVTDADGQVAPEAASFEIRWNTQLQGRLLSRGVVPGTGMLPGAVATAPSAEGPPSRPSPAMPALVAVESPEAVLELRVVRREVADREPEAAPERRAGINTSRSNARN